MARSFLSATLLFAAAYAQKTSQDSSRKSYSAEGSTFSDVVTLDFTKATAGGDARAFLQQFGFSIDEYTVGSSPYAHDFVADNVQLGDGVLEMKVSRYTSGNILSAQIRSDKASLYGSVRVTMKSSKTAGVCEGIFFYLNDNQETDIELLTTTSLKASDSLPAGYWTTNQALVPGEAPSSVNIAFPFDPTESFHEYRIDWVEGSTTFYVDGKQVNRLTDNVPTEAAPFMFNAWSSGNKGWSAGPPTTDSVTQIQKIELYQ